MIFDNGNFIKIMFLLFSVFFGFLIVYQIWNGRSEYVAEIITAMLVFFAFVGRSITEVYRSKNIEEKNDEV